MLPCAFPLSLLALPRMLDAVPDLAFEASERRETLLKALEQLREVERRRCEESFGFFARQAWHTIEPGTQYVHGWHVEAIVDHLIACLPRERIEEVEIGGLVQKRRVADPGQIRKLLITMPPRHMKSTLVSVLFPAWIWTTRPELRFLTSSYALSLAIRDSMRMRAVIQSPWYRSLWGSSFNLLADQNKKERFFNNRMGYRMVTSPDSAATGEGGDLVMVDDAHNVADADSPAKRQHNKTWWFESMGSRGNNPKTVSHIVCMQRVHMEDLPAECVKREYVHLNLPARYDPKRSCVTVIGWKDWRQTEGELLWPDRFDEPTMQDLEKTLGPFGVASQLQQDPQLRGGAFIKREWFNRRISPKELDYVGEISWVRGVDLALTREGDQVASVRLGLGPDGQTLYLRGGLAWNEDWSLSKAQLTQVADFEHGGMWHIESIGTTKSAGEELAAAILGRGLATLLESKRDKVSTALQWISAAAAGQIVLVEEDFESFPLGMFNKVPFIEHMLSQLASWRPDPAIDQADDVLDSITLAYLLLRKTLHFNESSVPDVQVESAYSARPALPAPDVSSPLPDVQSDDDYEDFDDGPSSFR